MFRFCFDKLISKKRYLTFAVILFAAAAWLVMSLNIYELPSHNTVLFVVIISFVFFSAVSVLCLKLKSKNYNIMKILCVLSVSIAVTSFGIAYPLLYNNIVHNDLISLNGNNVLVFGAVCSEPKISSSGKNLGFEADTSYIESDGKVLENGGKIMAYVPADLAEVYDIKFGDNIQFTAILNRPPEKLDDFSFRNYLMSRGCTAVCYPKSFELYQTDKTIRERFLFFGHIMREKIVEYAEYVLPAGDEQALLKGILLGMKDDFSEELLDDMSGSGFMHIAAVSGLHIMFLCGFLTFALRRFPFRVRNFLIIPILAVFACIADFTPSVCRAVIMMSIVLLSNVFLKDPDAITSLFFAALVLMLNNPYVLYSTSFILSFSATLSLLIFIRPMELWGGIAAVKITDVTCAVLNRAGFLNKSEKREEFAQTYSGGISKLLGFFLVPCACQIFVYPVGIYLFGKVGLGSILLNIIVIPCTMIVFVCGLIGFVIYLIIPAAAKTAGFVVLRIPLGIICAAAEKASKSFLNVKPAQSPGVLTFILYSIFCIALYYFLTFYGEKFTKSAKLPENT